MALASIYAQTTPSTQFTLPSLSPHPIMSSPPTSAGLTTVLERLASQLGSLEAQLTALEAGKVSTSSAHVRTTHTNMPDDFHPITTKRKGKAKAKAKATAPPKAAPAPPTPSVAKHSPHCPYQAWTFPMADKPNRHLITVVVPTDTAAHVVGRSADP